MSTETKLPLGVIAFLTKGNQLYDPIATGLSILQMQLTGEVEITKIEDFADDRRNGEPAVLIHFKVGDKSFSMIDRQFLQALVVEAEHFDKIKKDVKHSHEFRLKNDVKKEFENLFFFEDIDDAGFRDAEVMKPLHKALNLSEDMTAAPNLGDMNLELVGLLVNKRREDDVQLMDYDFPRPRAGAYPGYSKLRAAAEEDESRDSQFYSIGDYVNDYEELNGKKPDISRIVNVPRNWTFTPIFKDKGGDLISKD